VTKEKSMERQHCCSSRPPKNPSAKIRWKSPCLDFLGSRRHPPHRLCSKGPNYQRGVLIVSAGAIKDILKEKRRAGRLPRGSCSCTTMPRLTGRLQPRRNWPTCDSTTTYSLDCKNNWKVVIFRPMRRSLLPRRPGWTDKILNFFWVPCKI